MCESFTLFTNDSVMECIGVFSDFGSGSCVYSRPYGQIRSAIDWVKSIGKSTGNPKISGALQVNELEIRQLMAI